MQANYLPLLHQLKAYYQTGITKNYEFRKSQLQRLKTAILANEAALYTALQADLKKSKEEAWVTELGMVIAEINFALKHLNKWMKPQKVHTNLVNLPSVSSIYHEPWGVVLIVAPWNYPVQLLLSPLVGAIAAGNVAVIKPSEFATATALVLQKIIAETFPENYILCILGNGAEVVPSLLEDFTFDYLFYTGSTIVGKAIYQQAAKKLVPVTLELGGKSPCIIEADAHLSVAAKRIAVTKFSNCGQMCVAPDYVLVHSSVYDAFVQEMKKVIQLFFGDDAINSDSYGKIINEKQWSRIVGYLQQGTILAGGIYNFEKLFIAPTLLAVSNLNAGVMQDEIFGPVLPILSFSTPEEAANVISNHPNPLAFYVFSQSKKNVAYWLERVASGGVCINNASWHLTNPNLPFGGRGTSGMGMYHGKYSFNTFSHQKAVMQTPVWFDPAVKYPPFKGKLRLFKWLIR
ncbi:MAG: aldehyde dehydrogenase [Bacteroidota bacterium]|nr:aldehyde dehydrogenase [Bacteroidota bacterium]